MASNTQQKNIGQCIPLVVYDGEMFIGVMLLSMSVYYQVGEDADSRIWQELDCEHCQDELAAYLLGKGTLYQLYHKAQKSCEIEDSHGNLHTYTGNAAISPEPFEESVLYSPNQYAFEQVFPGRSPESVPTLCDRDAVLDQAVEKRFHGNTSIKSHDSTYNNINFSVFFAPAITFSHYIEKIESPEDTLIKIVKEKIRPELKFKQHYNSLLKHIFGTQHNKIFTKNNVETNDISGFDKAIKVFPDKESAIRYCYEMNIMNETLTSHNKEFDATQAIETKYEINHAYRLN